MAQPTTNEAAGGFSTLPAQDTAASAQSQTTFPGKRPQVHNIVATVDLDCLLDLRHIALFARNAKYNPKRFAACIMHIREPKSTALVFEKGKMVVVGAKSIEDARLAGRKHARTLQKLGFNPQFKDFAVRNMVANADVKFVISLDGLHLKYYKVGARYEPEVFPGLKFPIMKPSITVLVFATGKLVLLGAKKQEDLDQAMDIMYPVLSEFRRH